MGVGASMVWTDGTVFLASCRAVPGSRGLSVKETD